MVCKYSIKEFNESISKSLETEMLALKFEINIFKRVNRQIYNSKVKFKRECTFYD